MEFVEQTRGSMCLWCAAPQADRLLKMRALARPPPLNDEHAGKVGGRLDERLELESGVQHGVQVGRQHPVVSTDMTAHADRPGGPPSLSRVSAVGRPARQCVDACVAREAWVQQDRLNHRNGRNTLATVRSAASRSSMSINAMLQTTPSY